jgi:hypothetical protein
MRLSFKKDWFLNKWHETSKWSIVLVVIWIVAGILTLSIPAGKYDAAKQQYYSSYGRYVEYENQQRQYEQAQNGNNNNNGDDSSQAYPSCRWYQWGCRNAQYYYRAQNNDKNDMVYTPSWYRFIGGGENSEENRRFYEEMGISYDPDEPSGAMKFVYGWTVVMFVGLLIYGSFVLLTSRSVLGLVVLCAVFAQFSLLQILLCGQGVVSSDNRQLEDTVYGWYGQAGVLQVYTDFGMVIFCAGFCIIFAIYGLVRIIMARRAGSSAKVDESDDVEHEQGFTGPGVYKNFD